MDSQSTVPVKEYSSFKGKLMDYIAFRILEFSLLQSIYPIYEVYEVSTTLSRDIKYGLALQRFVKFIYSEKATKFCEIFTLLLSYSLVPNRREDRNKQAGLEKNPPCLFFTK